MTACSSAGRLLAPLRQLRSFAWCSLLLCAWLTNGFAAGTPGQEAALEPDEGADIVQRSADRDDLPSLAEVLNAPDDESMKALSERCLQTFRIRSHQILDDQHIVFRMRNGDRYLTRFPRRCFGLRRGTAIKIEARAGRLCRLDTIRTIPRDSFAIDPGVPCMISDFQKISPEQVEFLREALKQRR